ncbi:MAG: YitT family protein [Firmicutes bacterium]|nr:YitT family protein [Bacillota bacterium]
MPNETNLPEPDFSKTNLTELDLHETSMPDKSGLPNEKFKTRFSVKNLMLHSIACVMQAFVVYFLIIPSMISPGGVGGIAALLYHMLDWNASITLFALNIPLFILAWIFLNRNFALQCVFGVGLASFTIFIFEQTGMPGFTAVVESGVSGRYIAECGTIYPSEMDRLLGGIFTGVIFGAAIAIAMRANASLGGTEIISLVIQNKFPNFRVAWIAFGLDAIVIAGAAFFYGSLTSVMFAVISVFLCYKTLDIIQSNWVSAVAFNIITDKPDEVSALILADINRGATKLQAMGAYTSDSKTLVLCIVSKSQAARLKKKLTQIDPQAFSYMTPVSKAIGAGFLNTAHAQSKLD